MTTSWPTWGLNNVNFLVDTHVLLWRLIEPTRLSEKAKKIFTDNNNHFLIPTVSLLEVQYLSEIGRVKVEMDHVFAAIQDDVRFKLLPFDESALIQSIRLTSNRDPFDRMILGQALSLATKILTKDRWMQKVAEHLTIF